MYLFLIILGIASIGYGLYLENQVDDGVGLEEFSDVERLYILEEKVNLMEDFLDISQSDYLLDQIESSREEFSKTLNEDNQKLGKNPDRFKQSLDRESIEVENLDNIDDKYKLYSELKKQGHSLEEICKILKMTKGEVILLENLRRDYQK